MARARRRSGQNWSCRAVKLTNQNQTRTTASILFVFFFSRFFFFSFLLFFLVSFSSWGWGEPYFLPSSLSLLSHSFFFFHPSISHFVILLHTLTDGFCHLLRTDQAPGYSVSRGECSSCGYQLTVTHIHLRCFTLPMETYVSSHTPCHRRSSNIRRSRSTPCLVQRESCDPLRPRGRSPLNLLRRVANRAPQFDRFRGISCNHNSRNPHPLRFNSQSHLRCSSKPVTWGKDWFHDASCWNTTRVFGFHWWKRCGGPGRFLNTQLCEAWDSYSSTEAIHPEVSLDFTPGSQWAGNGSLYSYWRPGSQNWCGAISPAWIASADEPVSSSQLGVNVGQRSSSSWRKNSRALSTRWNSSDLLTSLFTQYEPHWKCFPLYEGPIETWRSMVIWRRQGWIYTFTSGSSHD